MSYAKIQNFPIGQQFSVDNLLACRTTVYLVAALKPTSLRNLLIALQLLGNIYYYPFTTIKKGKQSQLFFTDQSPVTSS